MNWRHYAGAIAVLVVGYLIGVWYPAPGNILKSKLGMS